MSDRATGDLFDTSGETETLAPGAVWLKGYVRAESASLVETLLRLTGVSPFRHYDTAGGRRVAAAMSGCGDCVWVSDASGYRYSETDPDTGKPWPAMPSDFLNLASLAAASAGFSGFRPDTCLINRYAPGAKMGVHRDDSERRFDAPIVSVSLGLGAPFAFGGPERGTPLRRIRLVNGDVLVWGGPSRLAYHGVGAPDPGAHPLTGPYRYNLTFRKAR